MSKKNFTREVLSRFMTAQELEQLEQKYDANLRARRGVKYTPTQMHQDLYLQWLTDDLTIAQVAAAMGCGPTTAMHRMALVAKLKNA